MNPALLASILFELLDLGIRLTDKPEDVEKYLELRTKVRKDLVALANNPKDDHGDGTPAESEI